MFTPIAIRVLSEDSVGKRKLKANKFYYFARGFRIENDGILINPMRLKTDKIFNDYFNKGEHPKIGVSAIVGENGSGKSSLIEFYLRLINNFAATTIGETNVNSEGQHLHFINGISGEFYYMVDDTPYRIKVQYRNVTLESYSQAKNQDHPEGWIKYITYNTPNIFDNEMPNIKESKSSPIMSYHLPFGSKQKENIDLKNIYKNFFYSFISNFSSYAYNTNDFADESNSDDYERKILVPKKKMKYSVEQRHWLGGLFWKNDGYQVPIVLSPFRSNGNIDINKENELAKERLLALIIMPGSQFREINEHLRITSFDIKAKNIKYDAKYLKEHVGFERLQSKGYDKFQESIVRLWGECIHVNLHEYSSRKYYSEAIGYLTYKTLKISSVYRQYNSFFNTYKGIYHKFEDYDMMNLVHSLSLDKSHITKKIRQVLSYIICGIYDDIVYKDSTKDSTIDIDYISPKIEKILNNKPDFVSSIDDLVPPPIFDTQICLKDINSGNAVLFRTLSSGERQQVYSISSLLYHLSNINSVWLDNNDKRVSYENVNVIMEEIELYFHPELQRTFIKRLFDGIKQIEIPNIKNINICIVTHSPFILSDIPSRNILALKKDEKDTSKVKFKTFGANIHEMLRDSFFLKNGAMGEYAKDAIKRIIASINENTSCDKKELWNQIMLIDEPIIRTTLLNDYHHKFPSPTYKEMRIAELERRLKELKDN